MKKIIKSIRENYMLISGVLITGLFLGWVMFHPSKYDMEHEISMEGHEGHNHSAEESTLWTCSMHPQIKQDTPGQCPICAMDLIQVTSATLEGENIDPNEIVLSESAAKLAEIQTLTVSKGTPQKSIYLQGKVEADERNITELTARFGGRIEKLFVNFKGQQVRKGENLGTIYSPDLVTAQKELLEAVSFKENRPSLYMASKAKLKLWDLTDDQITTIENKGEPQLYFDVVSPISGTVMMRHVALGDYVEEGSALFQVTDLKKIWIMFEAYESDLPWINRGDRVEFTVQSLPGRTFKGRVTHIDPFIDLDKRIANLRVELSNPGLELKPGMFANGLLHSEIAESSNQLLIPKSSILWTGKRAVVYVRVPERESPSFLYREITLGPEAGNFYVVADGLEEGEEIAVNGVFKIDAASQLEGKPSMMNPEGGKVSVGHDHGSMSGQGEVDHSLHQANETNHSEMDHQEMKVKEAFKEQLQGVYDTYILMAEAFVSSETKTVRENARKVKSSLDQVNMSLLKGQSHMEWMKQLKELVSTIEQIAGNEDIDKQRLAFAAFNKTFYESLKTFGIHQGTVYYQYCPMANGDVGAYWFSNEKKILNPYFGDAMLHCGETRETIVF